MSVNAALTMAIFTDLQTAVVAAWAPEGEAAGFPVNWQDPRLPIGSDGSDESLVAAPNGYVTIAVDSLDMQFGGAVGTVGSLTHENGFQVVGHFPWPEDEADLIATEQIAKVNALIAELQAGVNFGTGGYGIMPLVSSADLKDQGGANNEWYTVSVTFKVFTKVKHH